MCSVKALVSDEETRVNDYFLQNATLKSFLLKKLNIDFDATGFPCVFMHSVRIYAFIAHHSSALRKSVQVKQTEVHFVQKL